MDSQTIALTASAIAVLAGLFSLLSRARREAMLSRFQREHALIDASRFQSEQALIDASLWDVTDGEPMNAAARELCRRWGETQQQDNQS